MGNEYGRCRQCGRQTQWDDHNYIDEDGDCVGGYAEYCDYCEDIIIEREKARREWAYYHPGEACPEIELPPMPVAREVMGDD